MSVSDTEIKCWEYINAIKDIEYFPKGLYGLDDYRTRLHNEICEQMGLDKQLTEKYTDNLDKIDYNGSTLYIQLLEESRKNKLQDVI